MQKRHQLKFQIIGKQLMNHLNLWLIGFNESGKSFMFLAIPSMLLYKHALINDCVSKIHLQDMLHVPVVFLIKEKPHGKQTCLDKSS
jgi:hypothetical protein